MFCLACCYIQTHTHTHCWSICVRPSADTGYGLSRSPVSPRSPHLVTALLDAVETFRSLIEMYRLPFASLLLCTINGNVLSCRATLPAHCLPPSACRHRPSDTYKDWHRVGGNTFSAVSKSMSSRGLLPLRLSIPFHVVTKRGVCRIAKFILLLLSYTHTLINGSISGWLSHSLPLPLNRIYPSISSFYFNKLSKASNCLHSRANEPYDLWEYKVQSVGESEDKKTQSSCDQHRYVSIPFDTE